MRVFTIKATSASGRSDNILAVCTCISGLALGDEYVVTFDDGNDAMEMKVETVRTLDEEADLILRSAESGGGF